VVADENKEHVEIKAISDFGPADIGYDIGLKASKSLRMHWSKPDSLLERPFGAF